MRTIKKYANGQFYDATNKKYLKKDELQRLLAGKSKVKVIFSKTGEDITASLKQGKKPAKAGKKAARPARRTVPKSKLPSARQVSENVRRWAKDNKKWVGEQVDTRVKKMLEAMNLPTRAQMAKLNAGVKDLDKKVKQLEKLQGKNLKSLEKAQDKKIATLARAQDQRLKKLETESEK